VRDIRVHCTALALTLVVGAGVPAIAAAAPTPAAAEAASPAADVASPAPLALPEAPPGSPPPPPATPLPEAEQMGPPEPPPPAPEPIVTRELTPDRVFRLLWYAGRRATYSPTTGGERRVFRRLVPGLLEASMSPAPDLAPWRELAEKAGFRLEIWTVEGRTVWALVEQRDLARGAGAYLFRPGPPAAGGREVVLQAPHAYHDRHTGFLLARVFLEAPPERAPRAFFTNTIQRYRGAEGRSVVENAPPPAPQDADVCHNPRHLYTTASVAAARTLGRVTLLQLHGYGDRNIPLAADGLPIHAIVSSGSRRRSTDVSRAVTFALQELLGPRVRSYPEEVRSLGGTRNVLNRRLRELPEADFVHLEAAYTLRHMLRADEQLLTEVGHTLLAALLDPRPIWPGALSEEPPPAAPPVAAPEGPALAAPPVPAPAGPAPVAAAPPPSSPAVATASGGAAAPAPAVRE
jgi:hypothetical protein